jgi:hypothetical protein
MVGEEKVVEKDPLPHPHSGENRDGCKGGVL